MNKQQRLYNHVNTIGEHIYVCSKKEQIKEITTLRHKNETEHKQQTSDRHHHQY